ncbi:hypothetical protein Sjap_000047 [Stephania japonica]|uniref:Uncharacterized protein n=1 Tax=Stephania japonica TaxID=461633 RepID=A0AAP0KJM3_9MAGN
MSGVEVVRSDDHSVRAVGEPRGRSGYNWDSNADDCAGGPWVGQVGAEIACAVILGWRWVHGLGRAGQEVSTDFLSDVNVKNELMRRVSKHLETSYVCFGRLVIGACNAIVGWHSKLAIT